MPDYSAVEWFGRTIKHGMDSGDVHLQNKTEFAQIGVVWGELLSFKVEKLF